MKTLKIFWMLLLICIPSLQLKANVLSNEDEVILTVSSDGISKEEATKLALRSAIEQAYGAFISSNTTFVNDEIVKDEIVTIASGNIKSYEEMSCEKMPNGRIFVVLKAIVSLSKLADYAISKGEKVEFKGSSFAMNIKQHQLNKKNEMIVLNNLLPQLKQLFLNAFDYQIKVGSPRKAYKSENYDIPIQVTVRYNKNLNAAIELINSTFSSLYMSKQELDAYNSMNEDYYKFFIELNKSNPYNSFSVYPRSTPGLKIELKNSFVRNDISQWNKQVLILFWEGFNNYICKTNIGSVALTNANTIDYPDSQKQYMHNINSLKINYKYVDIEGISTQNIESDYYRALRFWVKKQIKLNYEINLSPSEIEQLNNFEISKIQ